MVTTITDEEMFQKEVINSDIPVLVDFFATWCGPCKLLAPTVEEISEEYAGKIKTVRLDIDQLGKTAVMYDVMSIPTLMLFDNGSPVGQCIGATPKENIIEQLHL